ncbi:Protein mak11 [Diaporthe australafricana]|uniref:Protein mak11 n=1 Tax=Diaporthe australafricana TaxID=127596 RepID=A0ABR3XEF2_9PEZI
MAKRKRQAVAESEPAQKPQESKKVKPNRNGPQLPKKTRATKPAKASAGASASADETIQSQQRTDSPITIQIIAGSYDRVLHGVTATIQPPSSPSSPSQVDFADSFLFNAHTSAIRCLALSPPSASAPGQSQKVMLATGSTDERINVYNLSAHPPSTKASPDQELLSSIARRPILENSKNRELGTLMHHSSTVTRLVFPTRSKLLSSSEDSTVAVTRVRDWSLLSTIKAPVPAAMGRPSGDTAPMGGTPSGVNDFAVHPSMKVMISVSKGERCMRLWNLVTGKKAGVLEFARSTLQEIGEGRHSTGEGRRVVWGASDESGDEFAVGFDRDVLVFGMDSKVRCRIMPDARTKIHEFGYVKVGADTEDTAFAVSTEDGRVLFFSTKVADLEHGEAPEGKATPLPRAKLVAQVGGKAAGVTGRVKDFKVVQSDDAPGVLFITTASSDGKLRVWELMWEGLTSKARKEAPQAGKLLGTHDTQNRITCMEAFVMIPRPEGVEESEDELQEDEQEDDGDSDDE